MKEVQKKMQTVIASEATGPRAGRATGDAARDERLRQLEPGGSSGGDDGGDGGRQASGVLLHGSAGASSSQSGPGAFSLPPGSYPRIVSEHDGA